MEEKKKEKEKKVTKNSKKEEKTVSNEHLLEEEVMLLKEQVLNLEKEKKELEEKIKITQAELVNYRKRKDEETANILKYSNKDLVMELLPTVDNFERALVQIEKSNSEEIYSGVSLIYKGLVSSLNKFEVTEINRVGEVFDPNLEQALVAANEEDKDDEIVLEVLQKGYKLKDRVIRPASVKINQK